MYRFRCFWNPFGNLSDQILSHSDFPRRYHSKCLLCTHFRVSTNISTSGYSFKSLVPFYLLACLFLFVCCCCFVNCYWPTVLLVWGFWYKLHPGNFVFVSDSFFSRTWESNSYGKKVKSTWYRHLLAHNLSCILDFDGGKTKLWSGIDTGNMSPFRSFLSKAPSGPYYHISSWDDITQLITQFYQIFQKLKGCQGSVIQQGLEHKNDVHLRRTRDAKL